MWHIRGLKTTLTEVLRSVVDRVIDSVCAKVFSHFKLLVTQATWFMTFMYFEMYRVDQLK